MKTKSPKSNLSATLTGKSVVAARLAPLAATLEAVKIPAVKSESK